ncbi:c-type cytochrome [Rhodocytophaga rosea]|uniref:C-type cytochrome n=1 Tax=Rhodocytophaga rosea TaxID=2704465 RepID=A0A6C0GFH2_9BACT|nr:c-type cytochrome [Rhodocytophaga rosea]
MKYFSRLPFLLFQVLQRYNIYLNIVVAGFSIIGFSQCKEPVKLPSGDPDNSGLFLPGSFEAVVVADSVGSARHMAVNSNGDIYVKLRFIKDEQGSNVALRDTNQDGKADIIQRFGNYKDEGSLANGMRIHNGYVYYSSDLKIYRQKLTPGKLIPDSEMEVVLTDDHAHGTHWHITKPVSFDNKGNMYVPFGSPSNACQDLANSPGGKPGEAGLDPCPELEQHGGIWKFDANKIGLTQKDGTKFATGIRSVLAMDWNPVDENLYAVMHGRDDLLRLWPDKFSPWQSAVLPSEEFLRVKEGADFGWPYCYYDHMQQKKVLAPEYGGDGNSIGRCNNTDLPIMGFPGHWAPNDLLFYRGDQFPERYKNGAFIAFHGSTNRAPYPQSGYFVCFVPFKDGQSTGKWEVFADGFAGVDTIVNVSNAKFRPMGLAVGPDGSLYVTESRKGKIWRIMYKGDKSSFGETQLAQMEKRKLLTHLKTPDKVKDDLYKGREVAGERIYNTYCAACHQRDGKGDNNRFPPLAGLEWVTGDKERLINAILNGLQGEIQVNGKTYNGVMPAHASVLDDQAIASIINYIRNNNKFGNNASIVSAAEVSQVRKSSGTESK